MFIVDLVRDYRCGGVVLLPVTPGVVLPGLLAPVPFVVVLVPFVVLVVLPIEEDEL